MSKTCRIALLSLALVALFAMPSIATTTVSIAGVKTSVPDNCGFVPTGTGWVRLHLKNDDANAAGRDLLVRSGQYYPLRIADIALATDITAPTSVAVDDTQACGYTRSQGLDECDGDGFGGYVVNYGGISANVGFYGTAQGSIKVRLRSEGTTGPWHTYDLATGEAVFGDIVDCQLVDLSDLTYLFAVAP